MQSDLKLIKGIGVETEKRLFRVNIKDISMFNLATDTPQKRKELSKRINVSPANLYLWSKQAELMKVSGITANDAALLVACGIRDIDDLKDSDAVSLLSFIRTMVSKTGDPRRGPSLKDISTWQESSKDIVSKFKKNDDDERNEYILLAKKYKSITKYPKNDKKEEKAAKEGGFFSDFTEIITQIGAGIAGAQHELDLSSIDIQNSILEDEELAAYGLNATWYAMPEINFNLKMEYMMSEEASESGSGAVRRKLLISPSNAKYNNFFTSSKKEESSLSIKFVALPPPERLTERTYMPDLIGMTEKDAREELNINGIEIKKVEGLIDKNKDSEVIEQSIEAGKIMLINEKVVIKLSNKDLPI